MLPTIDLPKPEQTIINLQLMFDCILFEEFWFKQDGLTLHVIMRSDLCTIHGKSGTVMLTRNGDKLSVPKSEQLESDLAERLVSTLCDAIMHREFILREAGNGIIINNLTAPRAGSNIRYLDQTIRRVGERHEPTGRKLQFGYARRGHFRTYNGKPRWINSHWVGPKTVKKDGAIYRKKQHTE